MTDYSFIANAHPAYIEKLYLKYTEHPENVDESWRTFFKGFEMANSSGIDNGSLSETTSDQFYKESKVINLIEGYRLRGHLLSTTNPIKKRKDRKPHLDLIDFELDESDLKRRFHVGAELGLTNPTLEEIIERLQTIYCKNIGFEYRNIENREKRIWLRKKIESRDLNPDFGVSIEKKKRILEKLNGAVGFEKFLHTKYVGQKRFSLEGGETAIPALDGIINHAAEIGIEEVVIGMAHRGRLNVLANIMGKTYEQIFNEFEGNVMPDLSFGDGDVKYHLGFSSQIEATNKKLMQLKLVPNPSHLESVNPVLEGFARAKADFLYDSDYDKILPILIHGDSAVAGQGIVYETVQMSQLPGYYTGGTVHLVINNQIGFTTDYDDARSSTYSTAAAYLVQAPVFHVNGDDPEAMLFASELALEYRKKFNNDVFIDMVCYRRHGHNEGDDPKFTQPGMYDIIQNHPNPREIYLKALASRGEVEHNLGEEMEKKFWAFLQDRLDLVKQKPLPYEYQETEQAWRKLKKTTDPKDYEVSPKTGIKKERLLQILNHLVELPKDFTPLRKVNRLLKSTKGLLAENKLDWGMAELAAYGSVLLEGRNVRMSGQDVKRGTFSHRHVIFQDVKTFKQLNRLDNINGKQGKFNIYNSLLSEFAVLGFEYGYSLSSPDALVLWEAQFGDFYNGAQTILDQYIYAAESKWRRMSGLVLLLPHGYEGQGPEHSSARLERFLQGCAAYNVTVANITSPANFFHALRRQIERPFRKPLIIMSPKSLLRHPQCVSDISEFETGKNFQEVFDDADYKTAASAKKVTSLLLCTGKVYYDLLAKRDELGRKDVAIVRIEQLYPLPEKQLDKVFKKYANAKVRWVQEESANMGAWQYILTNYCAKIQMELVSRPASASPATGFKKVHDDQQALLLAKAFE